MLTGLTGDLRITTGLFSGSNQKRLEGAPSGVPIFEARMTGDLRLVYRIDIDTDHYLKVCVPLHSRLAHTA